MTQTLAGSFLKALMAAYSRGSKRSHRPPLLLKVGDAGLHRNAGAGYGHGFAALFEEPGQILGVTLAWGSLP